MYDVGLQFELMDQPVLEQRFDLEARNDPHRGDNDNGKNQVSECYFCLDTFHFHALNL
jgi:hypothetical protein